LKEKRAYGKGFWLAALGLITVSFFLLFWGIGYRSLWGSEGRWAEITREMFVSGDFFHPAIGGEPYFDKPLVTYWVIAAISAITGRLDEFILRLPSAIAAVLAIIATIYLGKRLWSIQAGILAGCLLLTSYGLLMYSHVASAETENLAAVMLAVAWYWSRREQTTNFEIRNAKYDFLTFLIFYLIMFVGSHMKGLTAFVVPVLAILPDIVRQKRWRCLLRPSHFLALAIGIGVYITPFVYATINRPESYLQNGLALAFRENIVRYVEPFDHKGPIYLYFGAVPLLAVPWIPIFIGALITSLSNWRKLDDNTRWLIQAIALIFLFFTLSGSRRNYYILPILPFCMLLMAVFLTKFSQEIVGKHRERGLLIQRQVLTWLAALEAVAGPLIVWFFISNKDWELPGLMGWSCLIIGIAALAAGFIANKVFSKILQNNLIDAGQGTMDNSSFIPHPSSLVNCWVSIIMAAVLMGGFYSWQFNIIELTRTEATFARQIKTVAESFPHNRVAFYHRPEDKVIFYMKWNPPVTILTDENELKGFLDAGNPGIIIGQTRYFTETVASLLPPQPTYKESIYKWESNNKKLMAWVMDKNNTLIGMENGNAN
jgi:4-amino-4-deoxy-L-arabinose transferase-like glycosyltransferase